MANKYVDFVSDNDFLECVKWVCDAYPNSTSPINMKKLQKHTIDAFKLIFDLKNKGLDIDEWIDNEKMRQSDKTINNKIGEFHQKLLGKVNGWINLGTGDNSKVDLKNEDETIFIEIKNKHNTMNDGSKKQCRNNLENALINHPGATAYWAFIISNKGNSGQDIWHLKGYNDNPNIKKIWGKKVYELIIGDPLALEKVWKALPYAIMDYLKLENDFKKEEKDQLVEFFKAAFSSC